MGKKNKSKKKGGTYMDRNRGGKSDYMKMLEEAGDTRSRREKDIDSIFEFDDEEEED